jgi:hypothetical protein
MTKRNLFACVVMAALVTFSACQNRQANPPTTNAEEKIPLQFATYRTPQGWGYDILVDRKVFIHQDFIPAMQGKMGFDSEAKAELAARTVMRKLKKDEAFYYR